MIIHSQDDPWDPLRSITRYGKHVLTSVEFTVTNLCNMRCEHCAVGDVLTMTEGAKWPLRDVLARLDEVEHLETISITGGEPSYNERAVREYIVPLLKYARERGVRSQLNSNLTLDLARYEALAEYLDVMHISFNYTSAEDFHEMGFANSGRAISLETAASMYDRMIDNTIALSKGGLFVSAESMISYRTHLKLEEIHRMIVEMGCKRHEVHPMYPSAFARNLPRLSLEELAAAIDGLLAARDESVWMLFGTLPFFACSEKESDRNLIARLREANNVTVRNDPDGRSRLNVNLFTGGVHVTDFADFAPLGNIREDRLDDVFARWLEHPLGQGVSCYCPQASCCGPNLLVADMYYKDVDFKNRRAAV